MTIARIVAVSCVLLCMLAFSEINCLKANIVRELIITTPNSTTVPLGEHLYTISKNRSYVHINSTNADYKPCTVAIDPFEDMIRGKMKVEMFSDNEIFIWGVQSRETNNGMSRTYYSILWVNPRACNYKSISIPESDDAQIPKDFLPRLIKFYDTDYFHQENIDVYYPSLQNCKPCRFKRQDNELIRKESFWPLQPVTSQRSFHIRWIYPDYFYAQNLENGRAVLQYLSYNNDFAIIKQKDVDYPVETVTVKKSNIRNIGICTKKRGNEGHEGINCERLNLKLQTVVSIAIPITSGKNVSSVSLDYDDQGNSYISFAENDKLSVYKYDIDGNILQSYDLGGVGASNQYSYWDVHGFLVGNHQYCVIVEQMADDHTEAFHVVKCIEV